MQNIVQNLEKVAILWQIVKQTCLILLLKMCERWSDQNKVEYFCDGKMNIITRFINNLYINYLNDQYTSSSDSS